MFQGYCSCGNIVNEYYRDTLFNSTFTDYGTSETINTPGLENKIVSWLDGKWVVKQFNIIRKRSLKQTSLTLIRPTFNLLFRLYNNDNLIGSIRYRSNF